MAHARSFEAPSVGLIRRASLRPQAVRPEGMPVDHDQPLRIGVIAPPMLPVPPPTYAGTERVVAALVDELVQRGHHVTLFAPGDSAVAAELVPTRPRSLWSEGYEGDVSSFIN